MRPESPAHPEDETICKCSPTSPEVDPCGPFYGCRGWWPGWAENAVHGDDAMLESRDPQQSSRCHPVGPNAPERTTGRVWLSVRRALAKGREEMIAQIVGD